VEYALLITENFVEKRGVSFFTKKEPKKFQMFD